MADWADEVAEGMTLSGKFLAIALRQAKGAGMRLAAECCGDADFAPAADRWELQNILAHLADKIQEGGLEK